MFTEHGIVRKSPRIDMPLWLWVGGVVVLLCVVLAGQVARYLWQDQVEVQGRVSQMETGEPLGGAFVEVIWDALEQDLGLRRLHRTVVRTDPSGYYQASLPEEIARAIQAKPALASVPTRIRGYTARVYHPGFRHLQSSKQFYQSQPFLPSGWSAWHGGFTIEVDEPSEQDRDGQVRLTPVDVDGPQRIRQLYGTFITLRQESRGVLEASDHAWFAALCQEADGLDLSRTLELRMRDEICGAPSLEPVRAERPAAQAVIFDLARHP